MNMAVMKAITAWKIFYAGREWRSCERNKAFIINPAELFYLALFCTGGLYVCHLSSVYAGYKASNTVVPSSVPSLLLGR